MAGVSVASVWGFQQSRETFQLCTSMGELLIVQSGVSNRGVEVVNDYFMWLGDYHLHVWGMIRSLVLCNQARQCCCVVQMATLQLEWAASVWEQSSDNCLLGRRLVIAVSVTIIDTDDTVIDNAVQWYHCDLSACMMSSSVTTVDIDHCIDRRRVIDTCSASIYAAVDCSKTGPIIRLLQLFYIQHSNFHTQASNLVSMS